MPRRRTRDTHLPPRVYCRRGAYYHVDPAGRWHSLGRDLPAALAAYARRVQPASGGMGALLQGWLDGLQVVAGPRRPGQIAPETAGGYRDAVRALQRYLVEFTPSDITGPVVAQLLDHVGRDHPNMANRLRTVLALAMDRAVLLGEAQANPVRSIPRRPEARRTRHLEEPEIAAIRAQAGPALRALIDLCRATGQRVGDLLRLRWSAVRPDGIEIRQSKTGAALLIRRTPELDELLDRCRGLAGALRSMHVICQRAGGKPYSYTAMRDQWAAACQRAGVADAHLHDLRARAAHDARAQGLDPTRLLGHTSPAQTRRYLRDRTPECVDGPRIVLDASTTGSRK